jgi:small multidrug resistance pump
MQYVLLLATILSEVTATTALKLSNGFTKLWPSVIVVFGYCLSFFLLSLALKRMGVGTAYAIWSGLGTVIVTMIGVLYFKEPVSALKVVSVILVIIGVVGLNITER